MYEHLMEEQKSMGQPEEWIWGKLFSPHHSPSKPLVYYFFQLHTFTLCKTFLFLKGKSMIVCVRACMHTFICCKLWPQLRKHYNLNSLWPKQIPHMLSIGFCQLIRLLRKPSQICLYQWHKLLMPLIFAPHSNIPSIEAAGGFIHIWFVSSSEDCRGWKIGTEIKRTSAKRSLSLIQFI